MVLEVWWGWRGAGVLVMTMIALTPSPSLTQYQRNHWGNAQSDVSYSRQLPPQPATPVPPRRPWWEEAGHPRRQTPVNQPPVPREPPQQPSQDPQDQGTRLETHSRQHTRLTTTNSRIHESYPTHGRQGNTRPHHAQPTPRRRDHHTQNTHTHANTHAHTPRRYNHSYQRRARQPNSDRLDRLDRTSVHPPRQPVRHPPRQLPRQPAPRQHHNAIPDHSQHQQQGKRWQKAQQRGGSSGSTASATSARSSSGDRRPNIVLIMTDDQDVELGSLNYMPFLMEQIRGEGAYFPNAYCSTPICCPSRSSLLTGLYIHNHEVYTNNHNCSSYRWRQTHERRSFATYLADAGYRTGYFGKYLNKYNGSHIPAGWQEWAGLIKNSRYYNYTVMRNGNFVKYGDQYPTDYYPHVITNEGVQFLKKSRGSEQPMMLVLSYPAPHGPEDSAPEHAHRFFNATDHNTLSYNYAPNPDKQWLLQFTGRMHDIEVKFTDVLMTKRLQTLQTVDESVAKVVKTLRDLGELDNTFIFYTSDHGYHLGQFGLVKGKSMPFEFDIKVPFLVRGPGVKPGVQVNNIALNIDLAPTFLDIAGVRVPDHMDGRSLLPVLAGTWNDSADQVMWRDSFLVESSGRHREEDALELREARRRNRAQGLSGSAIKGGLYTSKRERLEIICQSEEYKAPCSPGQKWECVQDHSRWRLHKCRRRRTNKGPRVKWRRRNCVCEPDLGMGYLVRLDSAERRKQRTFLKKHLTQDLRTFNTKFIKVFSDVNSQELLEESMLVPGSEDILPQTLMDAARYRRSTGEEEEDEEEGEEVEEGVEEARTEGVEVDVVDAFVKDEEIRDLDVTIDTLSDELESLESNIAATAVSTSNTSTSPPESLDGPGHGCRVTGSTVGCIDDVYRDPQAWRISKVAIDQQIRRLRHQLIVMKDIRKHLRDTRPDSLGEYDDYESEADITEDYKALLAELEGTTNITTTTTDTDTTNTTSRDEHEGSGTSPTTPNVDVDFDYVFTPTGGDEVVTEAVSGDGGEEEDVMTHPEEEEEEEEEEEDVVIYGTDYTAGSSQEREEELEPSIEEESEAETRVEGEGVGGAVGGWGGAARHPTHGSTKFHVYPARPPAGHRHPPLALENETSTRSQCWCNPNYRLEHKQAERERKRQERQKLRQERQWLKQRRREMKEKKMRRKIKNNLAQCNYTMLNCYTHDNEHWRTPPLWHDGKFCFCMNAVNNTFWCLRTINQTHNFLFCEFITGLVTYYDLNIDPYQLRNVAFTLSNKRLAELHHRLEGMRTCVGAAHCDNLPRIAQSPVRVPQLDTLPPVPQPEVELGDNRVEVPHRKGKEREERRRLREERQRHREERRRLRKEQKKWKRHQLQALRGPQMLQATGSNRRVVRLRRKSRLQGRRREEERRREKRRERKRRKKSRRVRIS